MHPQPINPVGPELFCNERGEETLGEFSIPESRRYLLIFILSFVFWFYSIRVFLPWGMLKAKQIAYKDVVQSQVYIV